MRCDQCKHWAAYHWPDVGEMHNGREYGQCERGQSSSGSPSDPETLAFAGDNESYSAILLTLPQFGCVMFEPKPQIPPATPTP